MGVNYNGTGIPSNRRKRVNAGKDRTPTGEGSRSRLSHHRGEKKKSSGETAVSLRKTPPAKGSAKMAVSLGKKWGKR